MDKNSFKKYLVFSLCSAAIVGSAMFYFHASDTRNNTTTVIIGKDSIEASTDTVHEISKNTTTTKAKRSTTKTVTTVTTKASKTEAVTDYLYIDINSANAEELAKLKGIGEVLADEIISYRSDNGGFHNIEEIMNVKGIGEAVFADIRDHIYVVDPIYDEPVDETDQNAPDEIEYSEQETEHTLTLEEAAPININTADIDTLMLLPSVDEDTARRIIEFREKSGGFSNTYELLLIDGISRKEADELLEYVTIE
ncbi:helix-hairpin-helix domain-containing protein [uncultured Ruminococcus sp.]|uniref:ComEA family DNA-binding protein n=1 Tax=uncultured Ruminococcus sp. TaxID=165186 RepID=UPI0026150531|nr:helix-hairpin-helix domain-containing protein [uncultured Ruminococcus sp.]